MHKTAIFLGPSLNVAVARSVLDAVYLPPVKRGDLSRLPDDICNVGIIDGEFFQSLSLSPKEVMTVLERGIRVFGGASMGALRAVETSPYGMVGVGTIFEMYRDGEIDADDEVAMTYDPLTYRVTSEPLVNIRCALKAAVELRVLKQCEADEILQVTRGRYFPDRSYQYAFEHYSQFEAFVKENRPNQKRDDAVLLLRTIAGLVADDLNSCNVANGCQPKSSTNGMRGSIAMQFLVEPRLGGTPISFDSSGGDAEDVTGLLFVQPGEETQFDNAGLTRVEIGQPFQGRIQSDDLRWSAGSGVKDLVQPNNGEALPPFD